MLYHTSLIILHRPPRQSFRDPSISTSKDVAICYSSLESVIKLLRIYSRQYNYNALPFTFVHIIASAASIILMRSYIDNLPGDDPTISKPLDLLLEALDGISKTWPCAQQVRGVITSAIQAPKAGEHQNNSPEEFHFMAGLGDNSAMSNGMGFSMEEDDLGFFDPGDILDLEAFQWDLDI